MSRRQEERREWWRQRIAQQERNGQSIRAFCKEQGVGEHSFYSWRQRLREENVPVRFALLESKPVGEAKPQTIDLMLTSGDQLRIPIDAAILRLVLNVLRES
jgi:transposase-like protein